MIRRSMLAALALGWAAAAGAQNVQPEVVKLPLEIDGRTVEVVSHLYKPPGEGPFPLVLYFHGRAGSAVERSKLEYPVPVGHGNYWLRKGVAVVAPVRPGYGATGGADVEDSGARWSGSTCTSNPDYTRSSGNARRTVVALHAWALRQPWVSKDHLLIEGQSVGGMTVVAASALNLPGVRGVVNFAGGSGGNPEQSPGKSCWPQNMAETYRAYGRLAKAPSLWLYAENDQYWGPEVPKAWHAAYAEGGSDTALVMTGPVEGHDGHTLLSRGARMWLKPLDAFALKVGFPAP